MSQLSKILKDFIRCRLLFLLLTVSFFEIGIALTTVGGRNTTIEEVPFLVQILCNENFICSGTLASDRHIITAAHCFRYISAKTLTVAAAASKLTDFGIRSHVSKIIIHPQYNRRTKNNDIAVLVLETPLTAPSVGLPLRCDVPINPGDSVQVFGWGKLSSTLFDLSQQLQTVTVEIIDPDKCQSLYGRKRTVTENMFCASSPGKDTCEGDSGGPALVKGKFCGIVSWGLGCAYPRQPGVYTKVNNMIYFLSYALYQ